MSLQNTNNLNSTETRIILLDINVPLITINQPTSNSILNSTIIEINLTVIDDNLNYANISIIDSTGAIVNSTTNSTNGTYLIILSVPIDGIYNLTATAYDLAGNSNLTIASNITVDTTAPSITFTCDNIYVGQSQSCNCIATDALSGIKTKSISTADTTTIGEKTVTCTAIDYAGNSISKSTTYYVYSVGGGSKVTLPRQIHSWLSITPHEKAIMEITKKEFALKQIEIKVKELVNRVRITVIKLTEKPQSIKEIPMKVYKYLEIKAENLNETNLEEAKIQFEVSKEWIEENNLGKHGIYLLRYIIDWQKLPTKLINETEAYIIYEAKTLGFSYFAISGEEKICEEGQKRCSNNNLEECLNNSWQLVETCEYACNSTTLTCNLKPIIPTKICEEGQKRCLDNELQECRDNTWITIETCEYGCNNSTLSCKLSVEISQQENLPQIHPLNYLLITILIVLIIVACYFKFMRSKK